jgi:serine phosphatase RsbU (regulator of sigma subunit)
MEAQIAVAKISKYATSISGDTLEIVERPGGGISAVLADGQWSGKSAKAISNVATRKALSLLADGVRDGAAARAASDYLFTYRQGKVLATLNILSIDLSSNTMVITRNNPAPVILIQEGEITLLDEPSEPIGRRRAVRPQIREVPLQEGLVALMFTDGLLHAGERSGRPFDIVQTIQHLLENHPDQPILWADILLEQALDLEAGRPSDDISVLVAAILPDGEDPRRRLHLRMPIAPL